MSAVDDFVARVEHVTGRQGKPQRGEIVLLCPGHDDHHPSLYVKEGDDGRVLAICRSQGCTWESISAAIGWETSRNGDGSEWTPRGEAIAIFHYVDEHGQLLFDVCRTADKQFPQRRPDSTSKTGWRWNLDGVRRVPYHLPDVLAAVADGRTIWITEGERLADLLRRRGRVATCNPGGAGKWRDEYADMLDGAARVLVLADDDMPGRKHADQVARSLYGRVGEVKVVKLWPDGQSKRDVIDLYAEASSAKDADRALIDAVESTPVYVPRQVDDQSGVEPSTPDQPAVAIASWSVQAWPEFRDTSPQAHRWLIEGLLPEGALVFVAGPPKKGKTWIGIALALAVATGRPLCGEYVVPDARDVLYVALEGSRVGLRARIGALDAWS